MQYKSPAPLTHPPPSQFISTHLNVISPPTSLKENLIASVSLLLIQSYEKEGWMERQSDVTTNHSRGESHK